MEKNDFGFCNDSRALLQRTLVAFFFEPNIGRTVKPQFLTLFEVKKCKAALYNWFAEYYRKFIIIVFLIDAIICYSCYCYVLNKTKQFFYTVDGVFPLLNYVYLISYCPEIGPVVGNIH